MFEMVSQGHARRAEGEHPVSQWGAAIRWAIAPLLAALIVSPALAADVTGSCGKIEGGADKLSVIQSHGHATVTITGPAPAAGAHPAPAARVDYDGETYFGHHEANGTATISFALVGTENKLTVRGTGSGPVHCEVAFPDIEKYYRVIMRWHDPVRLDLHVIEPGRRQGGFGDIHPGARNAQLDKGLGQMDVVTDATDDGATGEQSYVLDEAARPAEEGGFAFRVDYASRGAHPEARFCGDGAEAAVPLSLIVLDKGRKSPAKAYEIGSVPCGQAIPDDARAQRLR